MQNLENRRGLFVVVGVGAAAFAILLTFAGYSILAQRSLSRAEAQLGKGFAVLAADTIDEYRHSVISRSKGCPVMLAAYQQARRADRLEWAAQACLEAGKEPVPAFLALANAREQMGRDMEALQILGQAASQFQNVPDFFYSMAQVLRRNKKDNDAVVAYQKAIERAPQNAMLALEALDFLAAGNRWADAKVLAERLKGAQTDNPEIKLFLARVFMKAGDANSSRALAAEGKAMLEKAPNLKPRLEQMYADVLGK